MLPRKTVFLPLPGGDLVSFASIHAFKTLPSGEVALVGEDNRLTAMFDPHDYVGVAPEEAVKVSRRLLREFSESKPIKLPEWMDQI